MPKLAKNTCTVEVRVPPASISKALTAHRRRRAAPGRWAGPSRPSTGRPRRCCSVRGSQSGAISACTERVPSELDGLVRPPTGRRSVSRRPYPRNGGRRAWRSRTRRARVNSSTPGAGTGKRDGRPPASTTTSAASSARRRSRTSLRRTGRAARHRRTRCVRRRPWPPRPAGRRTRLRSRRSRRTRSPRRRSRGGATLRITTTTAPARPRSRVRRSGRPAPADDEHVCPCRPPTAPCQLPKSTGTDRPRTVLVVVGEVPALVSAGITAEHR
jgi:hypothetical protein